MTVFEGALFSLLVVAVGFLMVGHLRAMRFLLENAKNNLSLAEILLRQSQVIGKILNRKADDALLSEDPVPDKKGAD